MKSKKGFSLIELLIVIAIIGILAALGVPKYKEYTLRAKFADVINATLPVKQALVLCYSTGGSYNGVECDNALGSVTLSQAADATVPGDTGQAAPAVTAGGAATNLRQAAFVRNVLSVEVTARDSNTATIRSTARENVFGGAYTYDLAANAALDGSQKWTIAATSTCLGATAVNGLTGLRLCSN